MNEESEKIRWLIRCPAWLPALQHIATVTARLVYALGIVGGCTYLVFWRGESGWLYVFAVLLLQFRRFL
ncbi:MAG: hypothetical protein H3C27_08605 [Opitutaceae bacterium]|nr:hypothetical protein [Opitutaceae bacterium]